MEDSDPALHTNGALRALYVLGGQFHVSVLFVSHVVQLVVSLVGVHHQERGVFLDVEGRVVLVRDGSLDGAGIFLGVPGWDVRLHIG